MNAVCGFQVSSHIDKSVNLDAWSDGPFDPKAQTCDHRKVVDLQPNQLVSKGLLSPGDF